MIVTIDGPSGSGKSSVARELSSRLGFDFLDTGAMYRAVALALIRRKIDFGEISRIEGVLADLHFELEPGHIFLNGEDVSGLIRTLEISQGASKVGAIPAVRIFLAEEQRKISQGRNIVCEGRDQGTFVFPDAECKFFLNASAEVRAQRRHAQLLEEGETTTFPEVLQSMRERDARDSTRELAPLCPADDSIIVDTSSLTFPEVVHLLESTIRQKLTTSCS
jgi:cytidylate kinase